MPRREEGEQQLLIGSRGCEISQTNSSFIAAALGVGRRAALGKRRGRVTLRRRVAGRGCRVALSGAGGEVRSEDCRRARMVLGWWI
jgi:hypothetical protein